MGKIPVLCYSPRDFVKITRRGKRSEFDKVFRSLWHQKYEKNVFKYDIKYTEKKEIPGRFKFIVQLNELRKAHKRPAQEIISVNMKFEKEKFNFMDIKRREILGEIQRECYSFSGDLIESDCDYFKNIIAVNICPIEYGSSLLIPRIDRCQPQVLIHNELRLAIEIVLISCDPAFKIGMNSLGAFASVNHLHFHMFYLEDALYLENAPLGSLYGDFYEIKEYPAQGFCFILEHCDQSELLVRNIMILVEYLQSNGFAYNIFITRGKWPCSDEKQVEDYTEKPVENFDDYNVIRIYVWARKPVLGVKDGNSFNPAVCELAGFLLMSDQDSFEKISEEDVASTLYETCHESFLTVKENFVKLYEDTSFSD